MAANILGPKPQAVPKNGSVKPLTFADLRKLSLDPFSNAMVDMEVDIPFDIAAPSGSGTNPNGTQILPSIGKTLYFCIPRNDQFLQYWNTVADRLFKIHNSLNLQGVFQRLPLFDPPIDPALLVRAAASGLDVRPRKFARKLNRWAQIFFPRLKNKTMNRCPSCGPSTNMRFSN